jgi:predicted PurR-regulated permease PerM
MAASCSGRYYKHKNISIYLLIIFGAKGILLGPIILVVVHTIIYEYMAFRIENEKNSMEYAD